MLETNLSFQQQFSDVEILLNSKLLCCWHFSHCTLNTSEIVLTSGQREIFLLPFKLIFYRKMPRDELLVINYAVTYIMSAKLKLYVILD